MTFFLLLPIIIYIFSNQFTILQGQQYINNSNGLDTKQQVVASFRSAADPPAVTAIDNTTTHNCQKHSIISVTSSGNETGNPASNAIDSNPNTRWSNSGMGSWIQADLGSQINICNVDIAWYKGDLRQNNFVISVSNNTNSSNNAFSAKSNGTSSSYEKYSLPPNTVGRYVRITVNGNTQNNFASISEIAVNEFGASSEQPLPQPLPTVSDKFGVKEIYPTKAGGGEEWFMNMQDPNHDSQTNPQTTLTRNPDGSYKVKSSTVRYEVFTSSGYHQDQIPTYDQKQLAAKGYMQSPNDWKNVEITGYFKVNHYTQSTINGAAHIELLARGGTHSSPVPCEGTAYHSNTYQDGNSRFEKELEYPQGYTSSYPDQTTTSPLQGRGWIGLKAVFYNLPNGSVKLEQWIDGSDSSRTPGNNWHKLLEYTDSGNWKVDTQNCGGTDTTIITWGGPMVFFRWDNIKDMDIKNFSVREIQPPISS